MRLNHLSTLESIHLFEASLVLYAQFALGATSSSNVSSCGGCTITAAPSTLTYPLPVALVTKSVSATVIPYIFQYSDGSEVTSFSTYTQYTTGASVQTAVTAPSNTPLTWSTLGTVLTYPTTYIAFITPLAGISKTFNGDNPFCYASLTSLSLAPSDVTHLIFPSSVAADHDIITSEAGVYLESIPSMTSIVAPFQPTDCSIFVGPPQTQTAGATQAPATSATLSAGGGASSAVGLEPVTHTSVEFLVQTGAPVITKIDGAAPTTTGPEAIHSGPGQETSTPSTTPPSGGHGTTSVPVLHIGGSKITAGPSGAFVISGQTLTPGGTAVVGGTTISLPRGGSAAVINGKTSALSSTAGATSTPVLNVGGSTITAGTSGAFVIGGQTLTPGGTAVVSSTTYILATGGSVAVVNGQTSTLSSAVATATGGASRISFSGSAIGVVAILVCWL